MNEKEFGSKLKPWLDRSAAAVGDLQATRLKAARLRAMDAYREPVRLFGLVTVNAGTAQTLSYSVVQRALLFLPIVALLAVLTLKSVEEPDMSDIDIQLLSQELPPDAFIDQDFKTWVGKQHG